MAPSPTKVFARLCAEKLRTFVREFHDLCPFRTHYLGASGQFSGQSVRTSVIGALRPLLAILIRTDTASRTEALLQAQNHFMHFWSTVPTGR